MKKIFTLIALTIVIHGAFAQKGLHIQQFTFSGHYVHNKDSIYTSVFNPSGKFRKMAIINPNTKNWEYINDVDYANYMGPWIMKNKNEGVMIYPSQGKVYKTINGWKTMEESTGAPVLSQIVLSEAGYVGWESSIKDLHFSTDGVQWKNVFDGGSSMSGTPILRAIKNKVIIYSGFQFAYVSSDGGQNFSMVDFNLTKTGSSFREFALISPDTFLVATESTIHKTVNGGTSWTDKAFPVSNVSYVFIKNAKVYFIVDSNQNAYYTEDGGSNWTSCPAFKSVVKDPGDLFFFNDVIYAWPQYKSTDKGLTWQPIFTNNQGLTSIIYDVNFKSSEGLLGRTKGQVNFSSDGGRTFNFLDTVPAADDIMAVKILNKGDWIVADRKGQIFSSSDKGTNWIQKNTNSFNYLGIKFSHSSDDKVIVLTRAGQPLISDDFGANFSIVTAGGGTHSQTVKPNGEIIDAVGWFSYSTFTNKGWELATLTAKGVRTVIDTFVTSSTENLLDVAAANNQIGYLVSYNTTAKQVWVYKTTGGFAKGTTAKVGFFDALSFPNGKLQLLGTDTVVLVADGLSKYYYSTNGGSSWNEAGLDAFTTYPTVYSSFKRTYFFKIDQFISSLNNSGLYLKNSGSAGGGGGVVNSVSALYGTGSAPVNIFPNPVKDLLFLNLPSGMVKSVSVFDILGREMYRSSEFSGSIEVSFLKNGVYILQVEGRDGRVYFSRFVRN